MVHEVVIPALYGLSGIMIYAAAHHVVSALAQPSRAQWLFACMCLLVVPLAFFYGEMLQATTIAAYARALKWNLAGPVLFFMLFPWFIAAYTGSRSLPYVLTLSAVFALLFVVNLVQPFSVQYASISGIRTLVLPWGETVHAASGQHSAWIYLAVTAIVATFGHALYELGRTYRRTHRGADLAIIIAMVLFLLSVVQALLSRFSVIESVDLGAFGFVAVVLVMSGALSFESRARLQASEGRFRALIEQSPFSIQILSPDGYTKLVNAAWEQLWRIKPDRLAAYNIRDDVQLAQKGVLPYIEKGLAGETAEIPAVNYNPAENPVIDGPASNRWVRSYIYPIKNKHGTIEDVVLMHEDITEKRQVEASLQESEARLRTIVQQSPVGITFSRDGVTLDANKAFLDMHGYGHVSEIVGMNVLDRIAPQCRADVEERMRKRMSGIETDTIYESTGLRKNGTQFPMIVSAKRVMLSDGPMTSAFVIDISERKQAEEQIVRLAYYDQLTDLPNRRLLLDRLHQSQATGARSGRQGALLLIDLDHFQSLNDSLGHDLGDRLLHLVAERLRSCAGEADTVARLGGDEFVVLLAAVSTDAVHAAQQAETVGESVLASLSPPFNLGGREFRITASIGATLYKDSGLLPEELLKQADIAMYHAKKSAGNSLRFFDPQMQDIITTRVTLDGELHNALEQGQFRLYYQLQVDEGGHPVGAEALIRWLHPERGVVSPGQFIPLAEETGLITDIGQWVLETACAQLRAWQDHHIARRLALSVNVSPHRFHGPAFAEEIQSAIHRHGIGPGLLKLEITEGMLLADMENTVTTMNALKQIGVRLSLDDFGTGYSSLQYLKRLPLDQLKIDQSFVRDLAVDNNDKAIVKTIISMARSLNLEVIAEGVETENQRRILQENGCTLFQGYLFGKPAAVEDFEALLGK